jgi:hypothetical protein
MMMTTASSDQTIHPAFTSHASQAVLGRRSLPIVSSLAAWRKGRVGGSGGLEEFVADPRQAHAVQRNNR